MAKVDDGCVEITVGILAVGDAAVDFMAPRAEKVGIDREMLEQAPVFRFGMRGQLWGRSVVIVMSALPLDLLFQADILVAIQTAEPGLPELLERLDLLPIQAGAMTAERFAFMGGGEHNHEPLKILFRDGSATVPLALDGWPQAPLDLRTGEGGRCTQSCDRPRGGGARDQQAPLPAHAYRDPHGDASAKRAGRSLSDGRAPSSGRAACDSSLSA